MTDARTVLTGDAMRLLVNERILELLNWRQWYRRQVRFDLWMDLAAANDAELRALLRLARKARKLAAAQAETTSWTDAGWCEPELREAFGR